MRRTTFIPKKQTGFTIVELMIATMVFSVILVVITMGVLSFTNSYYKGINSSTTQNTARTIMDTISQAIQFSGKAVSATSTGQNYFCAGDNVYMYTLGAQQPASGPTSTKWGLYEGTNTAVGGGCQALTSPTGGSELLGPHMRLTDISVSKNPDPSGRLYSISIHVAYGDNDLLCTSTSPGSCAKTAATLPDSKLVDSHVVCKIETGSQFCAFSGLSTTVQQRVEPN